MAVPDTSGSFSDGGSGATQPPQSRGATRSRQRAAERGGGAAEDCQHRRSHHTGSRCPIVTPLVSINASATAVATADTEVAATPL